MKLQHRLALITIATAAVAGFVYSQIHIHKRNRREVIDVATELACTWQSQLDLSNIQTQKLLDSIIEYTIKKNEIINSNLAMENQISKLKSIQRNEHRNLQNFLSEDQFKKYLSLNKRLTRKE
ncbi:hypothetical protein [Gramella sp. AN32]|uniref:Uncharacterized protein n=1 Tax=Christiangramia antarctica TaxID=2058158 RepID=A0ABW5X4B9_9FLAO|nr:hypothetical protein [Gramella sp. AN32]MCM4156057.1 hypothetical protein [Gramella sp. AN32]